MPTHRRRTAPAPPLALAALAAGLCAAGATTCTTTPARPPAAAAARAQPPAAALAALDAELERLMGEHSLAEWHEYTGEGDAAPGTLERLQAQERALFERARPLADAVLADGAAAPDDRRRATLWRDGARGLSLVADPEISALAHRLEAALDAATLQRDGQQVPRSTATQMMRSADAAERRAGYALAAQVHRSVVDTARAVLRRRAAVARSHGMVYADAMLELRGIAPAQWDALARAILAGTEARYRAILDEGARARGLARVQPWDAQYAASADLAWADARLPAGDAVAFARRALGAMGFDLDRPPVRVVVRDFAFGGQTLAIRIPTDVRTVVRPNAGVRFYSTLLHELGHGLQATRTRPAEAIFKGYEWVPGIVVPGYDEGVADVFGTLLHEPEFLARHATAFDEAERARLSAGARRNALVALRRLLAEVAFERAALADPEQDLDALERRIMREVQLFDVPDDTPPTWAGTPFLATYPMYRQSYVIAAAIAAQTHAALRARFGARWLGPEAGQHLTEAMLAPGERLPWEERFRNTTGAALSADALVARLSAP